MQRIEVMDDVILPQPLIAAAGLTGRTKRKNDRAQNQGGFGAVNVIWNNSLREYDIGFIAMRPAAWSRIEGLFELTDAGAYAFLLEDPKDYAAAGGEGLMQPFTTANVGTLGQGYGVPAYRLAKLYGAAGTTRTYARRISRPKPTVVYTRNGTPLVVGLAPGNISLNADDIGNIAFVPDATQAIASITPGATTVFNFADGAGMVAAMSVGQRMFVTGVTGSAAAALNGLSHAVTAKGATSIAVSTVTTGLSGAGGAASKYPQSTDVLAWSGGFYVPVHFASDDLDWEMVLGGKPQDRLTAGRSILLQEIRE